MNLVLNPSNRQQKSTVHKENMRAPSGFIRSQYGILMRNNWFDATFHFCSKGSYDRLLADYLRYQHQPFVFVDIGANQGLYSVLAGFNANCQHVVAFEPVSGTFSLLKSNIAMNEVEDIVHPVQAAVSATTGRARIARKPGHSGAASLRRIPRWFHTNETISTLGPEALKELIPARPDLIVKIDVEGHEKTVLEALAQCGALNNAKAVYYEVNRKWSQENALEAILRNLGFDVFTRTSSKPRHDVLATR